MKINKFLASTLLLIFSAIGVNGQEKNIKDVVTFELKNIGTIQNNSEITGYYMFYETDKLSRKVYSYELRILDQNLNDLSSKTIEGSKNLFLLDVVYNNKELMLKFYETKKRKMIFRKFDNNLEEIMKTERKADRTEAATLAYVLDNDEGKNFFLHPIENVGFVNYRIEFKKMKLGYVIDFYPSNPDLKQWSVSKDKKSKFNEFPALLYADENQIINILSRSKKLRSKNYDYLVQTLDAKTGELIFEKEITDENYDLTFLGGFVNNSDDNFYLTGSYYPKGEGKFNKPSTGFFAVEIDNNGNIVEKNFISWETDVAEFIDIDEEGKISDVGYLSFHNILKNADDNYYFVAEQYNKKVKGLSVDLIIDDIMILELDKDFKLQNVRVIDKDITHYDVPSGTGLNSPQTLSYLAKSDGAFDYQFSRSNQDNSIITIGYVDEINKTRKFNFGSITYTDSEPVYDNFEITTAGNKNNIKVLPAKAGNVVIIKYNPKEKSLDMTIQKLKY